MNKIKKVLSMIVAVFVVSASAYAVEVSVGASLGGGLSFLRGEDTAYLDSLYTPLYGEKLAGNFALTTDVMVEFMPFLALETGLGFDIVDSISYQGAEIANGAQANFQKFLHLNIPIMLRGQYEYSLGVTYVSIGIKANLPMTSMDYAFTSRGNNEEGTPIYDDTTILSASPFYLDIAFAVGQEFRLGDANYLGLRIGYDLNVTRPYDSDSTYEKLSLFHDNLTFSLTYRYAFNSKWKS